MGDMMEQLIQDKLNEARKAYDEQVERNGYVGDELYLQGRYDVLFELAEEISNQQNYTGRKGSNQDDGFAIRPKTRLRPSGYVSSEDC